MNNDHRKYIAEFMDAYLDPSVGGERDRFIAIGMELGKLYTDFGLPLDMSLGKINLPKAHKAIVLYGALQWLMTHKRNSGANDRALERQRDTNSRMMRTFLEREETMEY